MGGRVAMTVPSIAKDATTVSIGSDNAGVGLVSATAWAGLGCEEHLGVGGGGVGDGAEGWWGGAADGGPDPRAAAERVTSRVRRVE